MEAATTNRSIEQTILAPPLAASSARVFVLDRESEGVIRQSLCDLGISDAQFTAGNAQVATKHLARKKSPRLLVVDVSGVEDPAASMRELTEVCDPDIHVVAIGDRNDIFVYRDLKSTGIAEYFLKPLVRDLLSRTFDSILKPAVGPARPRTGKLIFLLGVRGGVGTTTIATMAAWELAESRRRRSILLDLDLQNGDSALQFDAAPAHALREALEHPERVDKLYLDRAVRHVTDRLDLMATLEPMTSRLNVRKEPVLSLLEKLLSRYRFVLVDLPHTMAIQLHDVLLLPSTCILISSGNLAAARDVGRWRQCLGPNTPERATVHILNHAVSHGALSAAEFARAAGAAADLVIPHDREIAATAILGIKAMQKCAAFRKRLAPILSNLTGAPAEKSSSLLTRVFG